MKNNIYKEQVCIKYKEILDIVGVISKGYILQKQLIQHMIILDIASSEYKCRQIILELEDADIIKKINFEDSKNKIIILRKFGIRFLQGKKGSQSVGAIPTCTTNKRYYKSIFINHYILELCRNKHFLNIAKKYGVIKALDVFNFNLILDNILFYERLKKYNADSIVIDTHVQKISKERLSRKEILNNAKNGIKNTSNTDIIKLTEKEKRDKLIRYATIETLKRKDCYIRIWKDNNYNKININIFYFDYCNTQNAVKVIENISVMMHIANQLFNLNNCKITFTNYSFDKVATKNMIEKSTQDYIENTLRLYNINLSTIQLLKILTIKFKNIDIYRNYLANVKKIID